MNMLGIVFFSAAMGGQFACNVAPWVWLLQISQPARSNWREVMPYEKTTKLDELVKYEISMALWSFAHTLSFALTRLPDVIDAGLLQGLHCHQWPKQWTTDDPYTQHADR